MKVLNRENLAYIVIIFISLIFILWLIPAYSPPYPGYGIPPSLLPYLVTFLTLIISAGKLLINLFTKQKDVTTNDSEKIDICHLLKFVTPSFLLMPAIQLIGFITAGFLFMVVIQYISGNRKVILNFFVSIIVVLSVYIIIKYLISVPLP